VNTLLLAQKELRDARRNRWLWLYTLSFVVLASALVWLGLSALGSYGVAGFGRTGASLINLILLIVPLMGLTLGALSLAGERERGTLLYLLAQPVSPPEVLVGKFMGLAGALIAAVSAGFGLSGLLISWQGGLVQSELYLALWGLTVLLALLSLAFGFLISALARKGATAMGVALFVWLGLVFLSDLGVMGTALVLKLSVGQLLGLALLNPLHSFKLLAVLSVQGDLEILGPAGLYALRAFGDWLVPFLTLLLLGWTALALALSVWAFARRGALE
jgi:Cu-processing system permease protein